ncbi:hypothetical protein ACFXO9_24400 [Nocardia tengchongensis]|uniref:hypothetical protein n=1 Tax=Nocardia tengchongensis TaxID=2055889 RepID=UPI0036A1BE09
MPDNHTRPDTVVMAPELLASYRDQLDSLRHQLGVLLGSQHPSVGLLREAAEKLSEPGTLPRRGPDHPAGYSPSVIGPGEQV